MSDSPYRSHADRPRTAEEERAAIVAWLRREARARDAAQAESPAAIAGATMDQIADALERGAHERT